MLARTALKAVRLVAFSSPVCYSNFGRQSSASMLDGALTDSCPKCIPRLTDAPFILAEAAKHPLLQGSITQLAKQGPCLMLVSLAD